MKNLAFFALTLVFGCSGPVDRKPADTIDSVKPAVAQDVPDPGLITCEGIGVIKLTDDYALLTRKVGKDNVHMDSLFLEGTFESLITRVWKGTPKEITVYWQENQEPYKTIRMLEISSAQSPYHFSNGVRIGTSLKKLAELNGVPVKLYGFGWDYGGTFIGFNGGKLAKSMPCFGGVFALPEGAQPGREIQGDHEIRSDAGGLKEVEVELVKIRVSKE